MPSNLKQISESPWIRIVNFFLLIIISLVSYSFATARVDLKEDIDYNKGNIEENTDKINSVEKDIVEIQTDFRYIREKLEEISDDIKTIQNQ